MSSNANQFQSPFLITSRIFPTDPVELEPVLSKSYVDIANTVNARTIGIFDQVQIVTGNRYYNVFPVTQKRQSYRQIYVFATLAAAGTLAINHGIQGIVQFVAIYGNCITAAIVNSNGKYLPIPYVSVTNVNQQIQLYVNDTQIFIVNGSGADNILSGTIVLEYILG